MKNRLPMGAFEACNLDGSDIAATTSANMRPVLAQPSALGT